MEAAAASMSSLVVRAPEALACPLAAAARVWYLQGAGRAGLGLDGALEKSPDLEGGADHRLGPGLGGHPDGGGQGSRAGRLGHRGGPELGPDGEVRRPGRLAPDGAGQGDLGHQPTRGRGQALGGPLEAGAATAGRPAGGGLGPGLGGELDGGGERMRGHPHK